MTRKTLLHAARIAASVLGFTLQAASAACANPVLFGPDLTASGWKNLTFSGRRPTQFSATSADELTIASTRSSSLLWRALAEDDWQSSSASWRWRVDESVSPTPLDVKGKDDRAIAIFFLFARDEQAARSASGAGSLSSAMWSSSGAALAYVWGGDAPDGTVIPSPQMGDDGRQIILRNALSHLGQWTDETADLRADFTRAFGRPPGPLIGIAIASDSDDTGGMNIAAIRTLALAPAELR